VDKLKADIDKTLRYVTLMECAIQIAYRLRQDNYVVKWSISYWSLKVGRLFSYTKYDILMVLCTLT